MSTRTTSVLLGLIGFLAISACQSTAGDDLSPSDAIQTTEVAVVDNRFEPAVIEVTPGDTVTWTWEGNAPHDVDGDGFKSEVQTQGSFQHTFETTGEYLYVCNVHNGMSGLVVVADS